ncbi:hypothetical protein LXL04_032027 [Taraxacum kok-saghyz]
MDADQIRSETMFGSMMLEHQKQKEELNKKFLELERVLDAKQELEMEIEDLEGKLQAMKHLGDEDDDAGLQDMLSGPTNIGIKRMGEIDMKAFHDACKEKFEHEEAQIKAFELCSLWQDKLKNPEWHPIRVIAVDGDHKEVVNEDDEVLNKLKAEWGSGIFDAVVAAFKEMNEYNPSGRYVVNELWNFKDNKEVISYILKNLKSLKRRRC